MKIKTLGSALMIAMLGFAGLSLAGCDDKGPMEKAGEKMDNSVENAGDSIESAGDDVQDAADS
ncbi:hypothetical protein [Cobetia sp. L2A1]|uniref:hypothetical protein n=1 Tax=Cobetia sp. L2A1 TaxID=2686360 RepID=UPI00131DB339|nr:hypothetical protein [Cobetia sp. L2A1]